MFSDQKKRKVSALGIWRPNTVKLPPIDPNAGQRASTKVRRAWPPMNVWIPNQPQATIARRIAGTFAPLVPNEARARTGNGIPYFVPGCALRRIGPSTMMFPRPMVSSACHQFIPTATNPPASMYVGMQWAIEIQSAAKLYVVQLRRDGGTGARSGLNRGLSLMSGGNDASASVS